MSRGTKKTSKSRSDTAVQGTNDSSILSKASTAKHGYFTDPFLVHFVSKKPRRSPLIHRGYYIRAKAMDHVIKAFLSRNPGASKQIVNLGSGFDSSYFRLKSEGCLTNIRVFEVDFEDVLRRKLALIHQSEELMRLLSPASSPQASSIPSPNIVYSSDDLCLIAVDLTQTSLLRSVFEVAAVDLTLPTLILSEVALTYMASQDSSAVIQWAATTFHHAVLAVYEQILPNDAFGVFMCRHFMRIGSPLRAIDAFPDLSSQVTRYKAQGWEAVDGVNMNDFFYSCLSREERDRMDRLEPFDEFEEWHLKCAHYSMLTAAQGSCIPLLNALWPSVHHSSNTPDNVRAAPGQVVTMKRDVWLEWLACESRCFLRFGHASGVVRLGDVRYVVICGGFGENNNLHCRALDIDIMNIKTGELSQLTSTTAKSSCRSGVEPTERLYHTLTSLDDSHLILYGGRMSPLKPCADISIMTLTEAAPSDKATLGERDVGVFQGGSISCHVESIKCSGDVPHRWRHSAVIIQVQGHPTLLIYGGRNQQEVLSDCWTLDVHSATWHQVTSSGASPGPRHSHTADTWNQYCIISCGLDPDLNALHSIMKLNLETWEWWPIECDAQLQPRYAHSSSVVNDTLLLIGGVSLSEQPPGVTVIHLVSGSSVNHSLPPPDPERPIMLHNHSSALQETGDVLVFGGGGNCFSFGTHLNKTPFVVRLPENELIS